MLSIILAAAISASAPPSSMASQTTPPENAQQRICKRVRQSGSRIAAAKLCLTRVEWDEMHREFREEWEDRGATGR